MSRTLRPVVLIVMSTLIVVGGAAPAAAGGGCHSSFEDATTTTVEAGKNCFMPVVARVAVGDTVTWKNVDPVPHTATGAGGVFDAGDFLNGDTVTATFDEAGVYPYACLLHPGMVGAIVVGNGGGAGSAGVDNDDAGAAASAASPDDAVAPATAPAASRDVPWRTVAVVGVALTLSLAAALLVRRRTPSASM